MGAEIGEGPARRTVTIDTSQIRLAVDIGGTFTDVVLEGPGGRAATKLLTTPSAPEQAVLEGVERALQVAGVDASAVDLLVHGTTLATNAIIERKGARCALLTTAGFRDTIETGYESRYDQYDIYLDKRPPLIPRRWRVGVAERIGAKGQVLRELDEGAVRALVPWLRQHAVESVAVAFLHSYANPDHERRVRDLLGELFPELYVTLSAEVCPEIREYERFSTASANAYVQPLMARYLRGLSEALAARRFRCPLFLMSSGGGLLTLEAGMQFPIRLVESGPAGGAVLASHIAAQSDYRKVVSFDMGGTTAKLCLVEQFEPQTMRSFEVDRAARFLKGSGLPLRIPVIEMIEIGAGGGSRARIDELRQIAVGPDSAGADPGPACYAAGGDAPTVTDADLLLGRIDPNRFAGETMRLSIELASDAMSGAIAEPLALSLPRAAYSVSEVVDERMANAARVHAIEHGKNLADHTLIAFGGAAPLHAARLAEKLGIARIVIPADAGVGSAVGFLRAPVAYEVVRSHYTRLEEFDHLGVNRVLAALREEARTIVQLGAPGQPLIERRSAHMRYVGQGHEIVVTLPAHEFGPDAGPELLGAFNREYERRFARVIPDADIEILSWVLTMSTMVEAPDAVPPVSHRPARPSPEQRAVYAPDQDNWIDVPLYRRSNLQPGDALAGPALIAEDQTTTFVSATFGAHIDGNGSIVLQRG